VQSQRDKRKLLRTESRGFRTDFLQLRLSDFEYFQDEKAFIHSNCLELFEIQTINYNFIFISYQQMSQEQNKKIQTPKNSPVDQN